MLDHKSEIRLKFELIDGQPHQIKILFELLKERKHKISHNVLPPFKKHERFVLNAPYRAWYLIHSDSLCLGSLYLNEDNSIGVNLKDESMGVISQCIDFITSNHILREEIKSKVPPYFFINVPFENKGFKKTMKELGYRPIQTTYLLEE